MIILFSKSSIYATLTAAHTCITEIMFHVCVESVFGVEGLGLCTDQIGCHDGSLLELEINPHIVIFLNNWPKIYADLPELWVHRRDPKFPIARASTASRTRFCFFFFIASREKKIAISDFEIKLAIGSDGDLHLGHCRW